MVWYLDPVTGSEIILTFETMKKLILLVVLLIAGNFLYNKYLKGNDLSSAADALKLLETMQTNLSSSTPNPSATSTTPTEGRTLVYFGSVSQSGLSAVVEADEIEMFNGDQATEAAMKDTGCSKEKVIGCAPTLNNNFYIRNSATTTKKYTVTLSTEVYLISSTDTSKLEKVSLLQLKERYEAGGLSGLRSSPFWITLQGTKIVKVEEQYIP